MTASLRGSSLAKRLPPCSPTGRKSKREARRRRWSWSVPERVDLALIDFNMTEKDGLELAAELRALYPDMPIAIITANIQDEIIARARADRRGVRRQAGHG